MCSSVCCLACSTLIKRRSISNTPDSVCVCVLCSRQKKPSCYHWNESFGRTLLCVFPKILWYYTSDVFGMCVGACVCTFGRLAFLVILSWGRTSSRVVYGTIALVACIPHYHNIFYCRRVCNFVYCASPVVVRSDSVTGMERNFPVNDNVFHIICEC